MRAVAQRDPRVRCLQRIGRRGLSTACIEGVLASAAPFVAVMDADLQHDERLLPRMLETLKAEPYDLVVGSRYIAGGGLGAWDTSRAQISGFATRLSRIVCKTAIADPMSGFFMMRRGIFEDAMRHLSGHGFKILLDLLASAPAPVRLKELPYEFRPRRHGESKLDTPRRLGIRHAAGRQARRPYRPGALRALRLHRPARPRRPSRSCCAPPSAPRP